MTYKTSKIQLHAVKFTVQITALKDKDTIHYLKDFCKEKIKSTIINISIIFFHCGSACCIGNV